MSQFTNGSVVLLSAMMALPAFAAPVTAVLHLKERVSMEELAREVQDPRSPRYGKFFSPEEIRDISGPSTRDYQEMIDQLQQDGFKVTAKSPTRLWVAVQGDKSLFEQTFSTKLQAKGSRRMQMFEAQVPSRLDLVQSVVGLDSTRKAHHHYVHAQAPANPNKLSDAPGGISPDDIKSAYGFNALYSAGLSGKGQHVAIATYDGFNIDDVKYFYNYYKLPTQVDQVEFNGTPKYAEGSAGETQLDAEFTGMIAPQVSVHVFASATNDDAGEAQMFTAILDDNRAKVVNYSWGSCEKQVTTTHQAEMQKIFARAVAQGVNIMAASGDSGSDGCQDGSTTADWPAANDNVVAVGGTSLTVTSGQGSETGWSGSGGGISQLFNLPDWQSSLGAPYVKRSFPDVAFNADPYTGEAVYIHNNNTAGWLVIGGTSMAAPQWSGFLALVGEARSKVGKGPLGYLNPVMYKATDAARASILNDVTSGSNGAYTAGPGWDAVTGYGSMKASPLLNYLSQ